MDGKQRRFNSDQLRMYMNNGVPLSHENHKGRKPEENDPNQEHKSKNLVLPKMPKMLPEVFSMSFYKRQK